MDCLHISKKLSVKLYEVAKKIKQRQHGLPWVPYQFLNPVRDPNRGGTLTRAPGAIRGTKESGIA